MITQTERLLLSGWLCPGIILKAIKSRLRRRPNASRYEGCRRSTLRVLNLQLRILPCRNCSVQIHIGGLCDGCRLHPRSGTASGTIYLVHDSVRERHGMLASWTCQRRLEAVLQRVVLVVGDVGRRVLDAFCIHRFIHGIAGAFN